MPAIDDCRCPSCAAWRAGQPEMPLGATQPAPEPLVEYRRCRECGERQELTDGNFAPMGRGRSHSCRSCTFDRKMARRDVALEGRKFGVEIEFFSDRYDSGEEYDYDGDETGQMLAEELSMHSGLTVNWMGYTHAVDQYDWKLVTDSSVEHGWELVSPPLRGEAGKQQVRTMCEALGAVGAYVESNCGLHVHHEVLDLRLRDFKALTKCWCEAQTHTDRLVSASRRGGQYARPFSQHYADAAEAASSIREIVQTVAERFLSLNVTCFPTYGTVEIRQHQGTTNGSKILAWIDYGQAVIEHAITGGPVPDRAQSFLETLPMADHHREQLLDRIAA